MQIKSDTLVDKFVKSTFPIPIPGDTWIVPENDMYRHRGHSLTWPRAVGCNDDVKSYVSTEFLPGDLIVFVGFGPCTCVNNESLKKDVGEPQLAMFMTSRGILYEHYYPKIMKFSCEVFRVVCEKI
jgi:hypothetical protein